MILSTGGRNFLEDVSFGVLLVVIPLVMEKYISPPRVLQVVLGAGAIYVCLFITLTVVFRFFDIDIISLVGEKRVPVFSVAGTILCLPVAKKILGSKIFVD